MREHYSLVERYVVLIILKNPGIDKLTIANKLGESKAVIHYIVEKLEQEKKIEQCEDPRHKTRKLYNPTIQLMKDISFASQRNPTLLELINEALNHPVGTPDEDLIKAFKDRKYNEMMKNR